MSDLRTIVGSQFAAELERLSPEELKDIQGDQECIICRTEFGPGTEDAVQLPFCHHIFDRSCIAKWVSELEADQNTCPKCRTVLFTRDDFAISFVPHPRVTDSLPDEDITELLDLLGGIPASVAANLLRPSATLSLFSGLSVNATRVLRQQYSDWFSRQTQELQERLPTPSNLPIEPRNDDEYELGHNYALGAFQLLEEEDEPASIRLPDNHQFPQLDDPEGFSRLLERIPGLTEDNRNELLRTRAELHAQRQRQVPYGSAVYYTDRSYATPIFAIGSGEDSNNASNNIPREGTNDENPNRVEANNENDRRLVTADDYQLFIDRSGLSEEDRDDRLQRNLAQLGLNIPQARTNDENNVTLGTAGRRHSFFNRSAPSGEGRNRLPRNFAELRARMQRRQQRET